MKGRTSMGLAAVIVLSFVSCGAEAQSASEGESSAQPVGADNVKTDDRQEIEAEVAELEEGPDFTTGLPIRVDQAPEYGNPALPSELQGQSPPNAAGGSFDTDFSRAVVSYEEVISGGPGKDGIPAIDDPRFVSREEAEEWLALKESVLVAGYTSGEVGEGKTGSGEVRIYPLQVLMWHEIVNDTLGGVPVAVTYCPLCNTGLVFLRRYDGQVLDFGTTGRLRFSNLIMYDRQTETWWQQASGRGIAGRYAGGRLRILPVLTLSWEEARARYPEARVLSKNTGYSRPYGQNPYAGYDTSERPFLYRGPAISDEQEAMDRVYAVRLGGEWKAFPYEQLRRERVVQTIVGGKPLAVFWQPGQASPLDEGDLEKGRDVGSANGFIPRAKGRELDFRFSEGHIVDRQTGSRWDAAGTAVKGPLAGVRLEPVPGTGHFWFSWQAFKNE